MLIEQPDCSNWTMCTPFDHQHDDTIRQRLNPFSVEPPCGPVRTSEDSDAVRPTLSSGFPLREQFTKSIGRRSVAHSNGVVVISPLSLRQQQPTMSLIADRLPATLRTKEAASDTLLTCAPARHGKCAADASLFPRHGRARAALRLLRWSWRTVAITCADHLRPGGQFSW